MRTTAERDARDLARGAGTNYLGYVARFGARAPFLIIAARLFGQARFGEYIFSLSIVEPIAALALFGLKRSLYKFMSEAAARRDPLNPAVANGIALAIAAGAAATVITVAGAPAIAALFRLPEAAGTLRLLAGAIPLIVISDILLVAIRFTRQMRYEVYARSIAEPITLSTIAATAYYADAHTLGLAYGYLASLTVAAGLSIVYFARVFPLRECLRVPISWQGMRRLVTFSGPTAGYELLTLLGDQIDTYLVTYFFPAGTVGIYGMARQFSTFTKKVRQGFDRILPPVLSDAIHTGDMGRVGTQIALVSRWILSVQVLLVLGFAFFGERILGMLGGDFATAALALVALLVGDSINGSLGINELPIIYLRPSMNLIIGAARVALSFTAGVWLIQHFGMNGAAFSVVLTHGVINAVRIAVNRGVFRISTLRAGIAKPIAAAIPAIGAAAGVHWLAGSVPFLGAALGGVVLLGGYVFGLYRMGLEPEERSQVDKLARRFSAG